MSFTRDQVVLFLQAPGWMGNLIALLAGLALTLSFAPVGWFPLAFLSIALLWILVDALHCQQAAVRAYFFGVGFFGSGVSWIYISIHEFGESPWWAASILTFLLISFLSGYLAILFYLLRRWCNNTSPWRRWLLWYPAAWALMEWVRGWLFTGFPWLNLGYSQTESWLVGFAPVFGVIGVSFFVALTGGILACLMLLQQRILFLCALLLVICGGAFVLDQHQWTKTDGKKITVALVQGNVAQEIKWESDSLAATLKLYQSLTEKHWDADLIVWPETAIADFMDEVYDSFVAPLAQTAQAKQSRILSGIPVYNPKTEEYTNSATILGEGEIQLYHKRHLVPFGEYVPLDHLFRGFIENFLKIPMSGFTKGDPDQKLMQFFGHPVGTNICYEIAFGEELIEDLPDAELLVTLSNNAWFGDSFAPFQILQMAQFQAREVERDLLLSTNDGVTAVVNARGKVQSQLPQFKVAVLRDEVVLRQGATPYVRWGNYPIVIFLSFLLFGLFFYQSRSGS